jgi:protoporphyrinogen IX oxidase
MKEERPYATGAETGREAGESARRKAGLALFGLVAVLAILLVWQPAGVALWIKAFHIVAVISWMAGLLYLPRLFVYHSDTPARSAESETFKVMERRLLTVIMRPAMAISWLLGLWLAYVGFGFTGMWLWLKIAAVVGLTAAHVVMAKAVKSFDRDERLRSARFWRGFNEIPTVLMVVIVILAVVKPF